MGAGGPSRAEGGDGEGVEVPGGDMPEPRGVLPGGGGEDAAARRHAAAQALAQRGARQGPPRARAAPPQLRPVLPRPQVPRLQPPQPVLPPRRRHRAAAPDPPQGPRPPRLRRQRVTPLSLSLSGSIFEFCFVRSKSGQ